MLLNTTNDVSVIKHSIFPGIELHFHDIHKIDYHEHSHETQDMLEITHCRMGRLEFEERENFFFLKPGDLSIIHTKNKSCHFSYPLKHYHGATIFIDLSIVPSCLSCFLDDVNVTSTSLLEKYCSGGSFYVAHSKAYVEHIFSELYDVPDCIKPGYYKIKILELLLYLSGMPEKDNHKTLNVLSKTQVDMAKNIYAYLTKHMDSKITILDLSRIFHVSQTTLKTNFKNVYGLSIYAYIKEQKMEAAAFMLATTTATISEIASHFGYQNSSKFSAAFRTVRGLSPTEYRLQSIV